MKLLRWALTACSLALAPAPATAEGTVPRWRELTPTTGESPAPRRNGGMIYDPRGHRLVLFGGVAASGTLADVWTFDLEARVWQRLQTSGPSPEPRFGFDAVYDPSGHQMVVWAGQGSRFFNDVWTLDLATARWTNRTPQTAPRPRYGTASIFESGRLVTFAGFTDAGRFRDTQAFSVTDGAWSDLTPQGEKPVERCLHTAAFRPKDRRMIVYGGQRSGTLADLWSFDLAANSWTELTPPQSPPGRLFAASWVDALSRFLVFGGSTSSGSVNETWAYDFDTASWSREETQGAPPERYGMMTAYLEAEDRLLLFGGSGSRLYGDVWELARERATPAVTATWILPSAARAPGANGAFFTTRLDLANHGTTDATYTLKLLSHDQDGRTGLERSFTLAAGRSTAHEDLLGEVFGVDEGYGAVRLTATSALTVSSQTSTRGPSGGTFGQSVPVLGEERWLRAGDPRSILGIREDTAFRTNLVLASSSDSPIEIDVTLLLPDGTTAGSKRYHLPPLGMTQVSRVVRDLGLTTDLVSARLVVSTSTAGGAFTAYAALIDNLTNDPRTLLP